MIQSSLSFISCLLKLGIWKEKTYFLICQMSWRRRCFQVNIIPILIEFHYYFQWLTVLQAVYSHLLSCHAMLHVFCFIKAGQHCFTYQSGNKTNQVKISNSLEFVGGANWWSSHCRVVGFLLPYTYIHLTGTTRLWGILIPIRDSPFLLSTTVWGTPLVLKMQSQADIHRFNIYSFCNSCNYYWQARRWCVCFQSYFSTRYARATRVNTW